MNSFANDNALPPPISLEDGDSPLHHIILLPQMVQAFGTLLAEQVDQLMQAVTDPRCVFPSKDTVEWSITENALRIAKQHIMPFVYEDIRYVVQIWLAHHLVTPTFANQLIATAKSFYAIHYTLDNPSPQSFLKEIMVCDGLHCYFHFPKDETVEQFAQGAFFHELELALKEAGIAIQLSAVGNALQLRGDGINRQALGMLLAHFERYALTHDQDNQWRNTLLKRHIQDLAKRELAILTPARDTIEESAMHICYDLFAALAETGHFSSLSKEQLDWLMQLHQNRKEIYKLPLVLRISLRSLYVCFYEEIEHALGKKDNE